MANHPQGPERSRVRRVPAADAREAAERTQMAPASDEAAEPRPEPRRRDDVTRSEER